MIPAVLPAPAPERVPSAPAREDGAAFGRALARAAGSDRPDRPDRPDRLAGPGERRPPADDPAAGDPGTDPGADGRATALAAMPAHVPAPAVVAVTGAEAGPLEAAGGATTSVEVPVAELPTPAADPAEVPELPPTPAGGTDDPAVAELPEEPVADTPAPPVDEAAAAADETQGLDAPTDTGSDAAGTGDPDDAAAGPPTGRQRTATEAPRSDDGATTQLDGTGPARAAADASAAAGPEDRSVRATPPEVGSHVEVAAAAGPTPATAGADGPAPVGASTAPTPPPVAKQLVARVAPLAVGPEGTHELTIELRPVELGRVQLEVTLDDGVLHVRLHADEAGSRRLLAQSLGDLRAALADAGITAGHVDVGDPRGDNGGRSDARDRPAGRPDAPRADRTTAPAGRSRTSSDPGLDVLL